VSLRRALPLAFASDTASITVMGIVDNAFIVVVPTATDAGLGEALFWWSLGASLVVAFALPLNRARAWPCRDSRIPRRLACEAC